MLGGSLDVRFNVMPQLFDPNSAGEEKQTLEQLVPPLAMQRDLTIGTPTPNTNAAIQGTASAGVNGYGLRSRLRHDLQTFVVGASNQLAHNAASHVAQFPGTQYTPLFIHGGCGLGKTHLLQGICRRFVELQPTKRWAYMTGEEFTNEFVTAMHSNKLDVFRRRMREMDLLVIDDVHFLSGKKATQEEFLHTFNAIEAMGRQVVMASDSHPKMIEEFGESLINRFVSGMVVRVDPPNYSMRCEILKRLADRHHVTISSDVITWIARRVTQNVRELEGAITRIAAHSKLNSRPVDELMAQEALGDLERQHIQPIGRRTSCRRSAITSPWLTRTSSPTAATTRQPATIGGHVPGAQDGRLSYPEIGHLLNKKNHSTVISACRRIEKALAGSEAMGWTSSLGGRGGRSQGADPAARRTLPGDE